MRLTAYMSCFSFRENKDEKNPQDWLPLFFDDEIEEPEEYTDEDIEDLQKDLQAINEHYKKEAI